MSLQPSYCKSAHPFRYTFLFFERFFGILKIFFTCDVFSDLEILTTECKRACMYIYVCEKHVRGEGGNGWALLWGEGKWVGTFH
jgi:hypothetical protein